MELDEFMVALREAAVAQEIERKMDIGKASGIYGPITPEGDAEMRRRAIERFERGEKPSEDVTP